MLEHVFRPASEGGEKKAKHNLLSAISGAFPVKVHSEVVFFFFLLDTKQYSYIYLYRHIYLQHKTKSK